MPWSAAPTSAITSSKTGFKDASPFANCFHVWRCGFAFDLIRNNTRKQDAGCAQDEESSNARLPRARSQAFRESASRTSGLLPASACGPSKRIGTDHFPAVALERL